MAIPMTAQQEADLDDPDIPKLVFWCLLMQPDEGDIAIVNSDVDFNYNSITYQAAIDRWKISGAINNGRALVAETLAFEFDAGLQFESSNFVSDLLARSWHYRPFRLDMVIHNALTGAFIIAPRTIHGFMDQIDSADNLGAESSFILSCETGTFRAIDRNPSMCSDYDQRRRNATDGFFKNIATIGGQQIPFGVTNANTPGFNGNASTSGYGIGGEGGFGNSSWSFGR